MLFWLSNSNRTDSIQRQIYLKPQHLILSKILTKRRRVDRGRYEEWDQ